ncbi:DUF86 domain-containing protein [Acidisphaera sp. L21]|jgi:uncharacterized protein with HEPN domain|uniref:HepT-like ribonuclease domain-containing protein n=1 Tax=Acidisphaera sp. L21 TaxID=1641851 RepID=UPI00210FFBAC|nr:HepT-like ribonuclease domain-containing protein [Acidisphaera sp. L21]
MLPRSVVLLWDAARALDKVARFVAGRTLDDYLEDEAIQSAVERQLEITGEALSVLRRTDPEGAAVVPNLHRAVGFRNILAHDYSSVDQDIIWIVATYYGPELRLAIGAILAEID